MSIQAGFDFAEQAAARAAGHADRVIPDWSERALAVFIGYAEHHIQFTTEDVVIAAVTLPAPPEKRAWGQIALTAQRRHLVKSVGYTHSKLPHAHARPLTLWRSLICEAVSA